MHPDVLIVAKEEDSRLTELITAVIILE
jgi:hypothetical protein